jgi:hypothetical protein
MPCPCLSQGIMSSPHASDTFPYSPMVHATLPLRFLIKYLIGEVFLGYRTFYLV